jgi:hypothetical protein
MLAERLLAPIRSSPRPPPATRATSPPSSPTLLPHCGRRESDPTKPKTRSTNNPPTVAKKLKPHPFKGLRLYSMNSQVPLCRRPNTIPPCFKRLGIFGLGGKAGQQNAELIEQIHRERQQHQVDRVAGRRDDGRDDDDDNQRIASKRR